MASEHLTFLLIHYGVECFFLTKEDAPGVSTIGEGTLGVFGDDTSKNFSSYSVIGVNYACNRAEIISLM